MFPHGAKQPFGSGFAQIGMGRWRFANLAQINQQGRDLRNRDRGGGGYTSTFASRRETACAAKMKKRRGLACSAKDAIEGGLVQRTLDAIEKQKSIRTTTRCRYKSRKRQDKRCTSAKQDAMRKTKTKNNVHMKERVYMQ